MSLQLVPVLERIPDPPEEGCRRPARTRLRPVPPLRPRHLRRHPLAVLRRALARGLRDHPGGAAGANSWKGLLRGLGRFLAGAAEVLAFGAVLATTLVCLWLLLG